MLHEKIVIMKEKMIAFLVDIIIGAVGKDRGENPEPGLNPPAKQILMGVMDSLFMVVRNLVQQAVLI